MDSGELLRSEAILTGLARTFFQDADPGHPDDRQPLPNMEARYRALVEQIPAVVFMAYLDQGIGEAYVSPQIDTTLGFSQREWLEDPVRWYQQIHPEDKDRWSVEAAEMFRTGELSSRTAYRVLARDGRVIWFHCEAKIIRDDTGRPWFFHGIGFDISDLKRTEAALADVNAMCSPRVSTPSEHSWLFWIRKVISFGSTARAKRRRDFGLRKCRTDVYWICSRRKNTNVFNWPSIRCSPEFL